MGPTILAKILTVHNIVYFVISTLIAAAIVNKRNLSNKSMVWIIPLVWIGLGILFWLLGGLFKLVIVPLIIIGFIVAVVMYLKKEGTI